MIRKTKQIKLNIMDNLSVKYGTLDKNSPDVLFIRFKGKIIPNALLYTPYIIIPTIIKNDFLKEIVKLKAEFDKIIKDILINYCDIFDCKRYLCNIEVSEKGVTYKKGSYIKFDVFVRPNEIKDIMCYEDVITRMSIEINNEIINILSKLNLKYL